MYVSVQYTSGSIVGDHTVADKTNISELPLHASALVANNWVCNSHILDWRIVCTPVLDNIFYDYPQ